MLDTYPQPGSLTTFRILTKQDRNRLKSSLRRGARVKRTVLFIPLLADEFTAPENRPIFENILSQLAQVKYLHRIILGLDRATEEEAYTLAALLNQHRIKDAVIQWNDGAAFSRIYDILNEAGFIFLEPGKGKNMFLGFGIALALGAKVVGVLDADIRSFERVQLDRLLYPLVVHDYDFAKAYYYRISEGRLFGRVKRLLLDPLLVALKIKFVESRDHKMLRLLEFLMMFNYQLSGEVAFHSELLKKLRFATNWGAEIFTLIEIYRKAASSAQVMFSERPFDHKHQAVSEADETKGLNRMGIDIVTTLINALVQDEGLEVSEDFFRDLTIIYSRVVDQQIKMVADEASFNNLRYDRDEEERLALTVFRNCIFRAGEILTTQSQITGRFLRVIHTYPEFKKYLEAGLAETLLSVENQMKRAFFETPQTVSWERITDKLPEIFKTLNQTVKQEKARFARSLNTAVLA